MHKLSKLSKRNEYRLGQLFAAYQHEKRRETYRNAQEEFKKSLL